MTFSKKYYLYLVALRKKTIYPPGIVSGVVSCENKTLSEVVSTVVTQWLIAFLHSVGPTRNVHVN